MPSVSVTRHAALTELRHEPAALFLACTLLLLLVQPAATLQDPDTFWHIATGRQIWSTGAVPRVDGFSHTLAGAPWAAKEWLAQLILYAAYSLAGWQGVAGLACLVPAMSVTLLLVLLARQVVLTVALTLAFGALALTMPLMNARPQMFVMPLLILWVWGLACAVERGAAPPWWLVPLMAAWANLHASFPVAFVLAGCLGLEALVLAPGAQRVRTALRWAAFGLAAFAATALTPYGLEAVLIPLRVMGSNEAVPYIVEWQAPALNLLGGLAAALLVAALLILLSRRSTVPRAVPVLLCGALLFKYMRFYSLFAIVAALMVAGPLSRRFPACAARAVCVSVHWQARLSALAAGLLVACAALAVLGRAEPNPAISPTPALEAARVAGLSGPVYNDYNFGGFLIHRGVMTFIDGRTDQLFLGGFTRTLMDAENGPDDAPFLAILDRYGVTWAIVRPTVKAAEKLGRAPGWREVFRDEHAVVFAKGG